MSHDHEGEYDRRQTLKCMLWAGTGVVWTVAGGVPASRLIGSAKANEFDDAQQMIARAKLDVHYSPGEHDILDPKTRDAYLERFGKGATGGGWYSFDQGGVHFVSLNNVVDLKKNGLGSLGADQLEWLENDLKGKTASTPIVIFSHIPLWMIAPEWGWGTEDSAQALALL